MPTVNPNDAYAEYLFSAEELLIAQQFTLLQLAYLQNLRARELKKRASMPMPENPSDDRMFFLHQAEIEGAANMITTLMDNHIKAIKDSKIPPENREESSSADGVATAILSARADKLVD